MAIVNFQQISQTSVVSIVDFEQVSAEWENTEMYLNERNINKKWVNERRMVQKTPHTVKFETKVDLTFT